MLDLSSVGYPLKEVAEWIGIAWRLPPESGGAFDRNRVAECAGIRTPQRPELSFNFNRCPIHYKMTFRRLVYIYQQGHQE